MANIHILELPTELRQKIVSTKKIRHNNAKDMLLTFTLHSLQFAYLIVADFDTVANSNRKPSQAISIMSVCRTIRHEAKDEWTRRLEHRLQDLDEAVRTSVKYHSCIRKLNKKGMFFLPALITAHTANKFKFVEAEKRLRRLRLVDEHLKSLKVGRQSLDGGLDWAAVAAAKLPGLKIRGERLN